MKNDILKKFYFKIKLESILNSVISGLGISCIINIVLLLSTYFINSMYLLTVIIISVFNSLIAILLFYRFKYNKNEKEIAKRVDSSGLKERVITMYELKYDFSYIAQLQREDTIKELDNMTSKSLKLLVNIKRTIYSSCISFFMISLTLFTVITAVNILDYDYKDVINNQYYVVSYDAVKGGYIDGEIYQYVLLGNNSTTVSAIAEDGYVFDAWSDGVYTSTRTDLNIENKIEVVAYFKVDINIDGGNDKDDDLSLDMEDMEGVMPDISGAAGQYEDYNQVIDGDTYYKDVYDQYYQQALDMLENGEEIPEYLKQIILLYYGVIL